jgi:hypothetical protein
LKIVDEEMTMDNAMKYELIKRYIEGALSIQLESDFAYAYQKGIKSVQEYINYLDENMPRKPKKIA